jgi:hypothetical protein
MKSTLTKRVLATAISTAALSLSLPAMAACEDLASMQIENGSVVSAETVSAGAFAPPAGFLPPPGISATSFADMPEFCRARLTLSPSAGSDINSEVWLPVSGWNGRYTAIGNGIWAGTMSFAEMGRTLERGYATATTDTGHTGNGLTAEWAVGHPERLVDFGYRAVHATTVAAKAVIEEFYGRGPEFSFWNSCSTGGRQGLMAAHRYPGDFDAISAMAPANPMTDLMTQSMWLGWQAHRFGVQLGPQQLGLVHSAVLRQCDALDGLEDGVIGRPLQCGFDPASLQCEAGRQQGCLSAGQVSAMRNFYDGVRASDGAWLLPSWPRGSEMQLAALTMGAEPFPVAMSYFRDLVYQGREGWDWRSTDYRTYMQDAREYGADILDVPPDGLDAYFARGGKLLLSHGWSDGLIPATNTLAFHHDLYNSVPAGVAQQQLRLFMAPGMDHCSGGEGPSQFDTLGTIDEWATTGVAPNRIVATRPVQAMGGFGGPPPPPRDPMERPLCAWPTVAVYDGHGDSAVADSFICETE